MTQPRVISPRLVSKWHAQPRIPFRIHSPREAFPAASVMFLIDLLHCSAFIPRRLRVRWSTGEALTLNFDYSSMSETMNKLKQWLHYVIITMPVLYVYSESASYEVLSRVGVISSQVLGHLKSSWKSGYSQQEQSMDYTNNMWWNHTWEVAFFTKNGERLSKPSEETPCEGDVSLQGVFRWFLFWAR